MNTGNDGRTSVNVMISFPPIPELNLTFLTPQPGALFPGIVQSHKSSYSQPLAVPIALVPVLPIPPVAQGGASAVRSKDLRQLAGTYIPHCDHALLRCDGKLGAEG